MKNLRNAEPFTGLDDTRPKRSGPKMGPIAQGFYFGVGFTFAVYLTTVAFAVLVAVGFGAVFCLMAIAAHH